MASFGTVVKTYNIIPFYKVIYIYYIESNIRMIEIIREHITLLTAAICDSGLGEAAKGVCFLKKILLCSLSFLH